MSSICACLQVAVACIKVASQAVSTMPSLFFFPILPFIMTVCLIVYWVVVAGYLYSAGTITAKMTTASTSTALTLSVSHSHGKLDVIKLKRMSHSQGQLCSSKLINMSHSHGDLFLHKLKKMCVLQDDLQCIACKAYIAVVKICQPCIHICQ